MANDLLRIIVLVLAGVVLFNVYKQSQASGKSSEYAEQTAPAVTGKNALLEKVEGNVRLNGSTGPTYDVEAGVKPHEEDKSQLYDYNYQVLPYPQIATTPTDSYFMAGGICQPSDPGCYSGSTLQAPDLLPHDLGDNAWNETSPRAQGHITDQNFLESGHHYGINTVGQSLKNPNRQIRSDPPIPKVNIGPQLTGV